MTRNRNGFTIIELTLAMAIMGAVAALALPAYVGFLDKAKVARCIAEIRYIEKSISAFRAASETLPMSLAEAGADQMTDPWGRPYEYLNIVALGLKGGEDGGNGKEGGGNGGGNSGNNGNNGGNGGGGGGGGGGNDGSNSGGSKGGNEGKAWLGPDAAYAGGPDEKDNGKADKQKPRKDRFLKPISSDYDLYSIGKDGQSKENLNHKLSADDVIRANDGAFVGLASQF
jgi:general secretion pathway protein G